MKDRTRMRATTRALLAAVAVPAAVLLTPATALACGGFFCSQTPIDQSGEQIVFAVEDGHVTAHIQISFAGEAEDFAWVIPVASKPEIAVGAQSLFTTLRNATEPQWYLEWDYTTECSMNWGWDAEADGAGAPSAGGGGVNVIDEKEVGPYQTVTLESDDASELVAWLNANGFDQPPESTPLIEHYLAQDMLFVALKLKQDAGVGDIQPVVLDFEESQPCVPLILTQIAATPDMPVRAYILGEARAIPTNWFHVELNQKKIDWLNYGSNYEQVVTQAVDEASGHGFVTEYAGATTNLKGALWSEDRYDLEKLAKITSPAQFVMELLNQGFPRDAQMQALLRKHIPMPESLQAKGVTEQDFYNCLECYSEDLANFAFDPAAFTKDLDEKIVAPLKAAQEMIDKYPKMTRLYTTVSPEEMDRDPLFDFNASLPDVSNVHTAKAKAICGENNSVEAVIVTLEGGDTFQIPGPFEGWYPGAGGGADWAEGEPAASRIELYSTSGEPRRVPRETTDYYDEQLDTQKPPKVIEELDREPVNGGTGNPSSGGQPGAQPTAATGGGGNGGCNTTGGAGGAAAAMMALLAVLGLRRRRSV
jgi:uncharacterized protein (TIGR03382 family)